MKKIPVLFLIFNREEVALQSLASIKKYSPDRLYIAADGPRTEKPEEYNLCENTRNSVLKAIDWDCEIKTLFKDENLGCANAVYNAISWFFKNEESGIIIEDDVVIHPDFYRLCEQLLPHFKNEEKIMLITAQNHTPDLANADKLCFSNGCYIWGWASWRRAWDKMDMNMSQWPQYKFKDLVENFGFIYACFLLYYWNKAYKQQMDSWATRWFFSVLINNGLCVSSNVNLSVNTGITIGGVHYEKGDIDPYTHIPFGSIKWPVQIPYKIAITKEKILAERKEFIRIRKIGLKKKIRKYLHLFNGT
jgi:GR25 family glycosyltransferase involved in LPS biosynthesis